MSSINKEFPKDLHQASVGEFNPFHSQEKETKESLSRRDHMSFVQLGKSLLNLSLVFSFLSPEGQQSYFRNAQQFNKAREGLKKGEYLPKSLSGESLKERLSKISSLLSKNISKWRPAKQRDLEISSQERKPAQVSKKAQVLSILSLSILAACVPVEIQQVEARETKETVSFQNTLEATENVPELKPSLAETEIPTTTPTTTATATETITPQAILTRDELEGGIEEAIAALPKDREELVRTVLDNKAISEFLNRLKVEGIIGSPSFIEDVGISISLSGNVVVSIPEYLARSGEVFHDYNITNSMNPEDNRPLIATLEGAKSVAEELGIQAVSITSVGPGETYRIVAKDAQGVVILAVSSEDGQWKKVDEATGERVLKKEGLIKDVVAPAEIVKALEGMRALEIPMTPTFASGVSNYEIMGGSARYAFRGKDIEILDEPIFLDAGKTYAVTATTQAYFKLLDEEGNEHYQSIKIPLLIFNKNTLTFIHIAGNWPGTSSFIPENRLFNEGLVRNLLQEGYQEKTFTVGLNWGKIPEEEISSSSYKNYVGLFVEFWRDLYGEVYTDQELENLFETGDFKQFSKDGNIPEDLTLFFFNVFHY